MIRHILKDGSCVTSVAGITVKADQFDALYRMMEKGGRRIDRALSASEKSSAGNRRKK